MSAARELEARRSTKYEEASSKQQDRQWPVAPFLFPHALFALCPLPFVPFLFLIPIPIATARHEPRSHVVPRCAPPPPSSKGPRGPWWLVDRPAARSHRPKGAVLARFKGNNTRRSLFFFCVCWHWHGTSKQHFRSKIFAPRSWWSCSATASGSRATHGGTFYPHP
jgi:hypothetical protein